MHKLLSLLLVIAFVTLASLIPGGPVETRDFSHISPIVLSSFNFFLTVLGLGSLVFAFFVHLEDKWAVVGSLAVGISYVAVYTLDLAEIFPVSPTPMTLLLTLIEIFSVVVALGIVFISAKLLLKQDSVNPALPPRLLWRNTLRYLVIGIALTIAITLYATLSSMGRIH